jgi:riboflavin kinase/FMN adenylyltransferase
VGNFDGVHLGHQALLRRARAEADARNADVVVVTFQRHPSTVLRPEKAPPPLMQVSQRMAGLLEHGVDRIEWLQPDPATLGLEPRQFVELMVQRHKPVMWVEGPDFRFGKGRAGDLSLLRQLGNEIGFEVVVLDRVEAVLSDKTIVPVSSSMVRWLLAAARVSDVQICLGRPYGVRGEVVQGEQRGRTIGYPTVNLDTADQLLPADGVYAGTVELDGRTHLAAVSIGTKPTFGDKPRTFEAYILDFSGDLYGRVLEVKLPRFLREQAVYTNIDDLVRQIDSDVQLIRRLAERGMLAAAELLTT